KENVKITGGSRFSTWSYDNGVLTQTDNRIPAITNILAVSADEDVKRNISAFAAADIGSSAAAALADFGKIENDATIAEAMQRLMKPQGSSIALPILDTNTTNIFSRINFVTAPSLAQAGSANVTGASGG